VQPGGSNDELWASSEVGAGCCGSQAATSSVLGAPPSAIDRRPAHNLNATTRSSAGSASQAKRGEDQGDKGEDEAGRKAKIEAPKVKTKPGEERRSSKRQRRGRSRAKRGEDQGAKGEDEGKRSETKADAPFAKSKTSKGRRRRASTSEAAKGSCSPNDDVRTWALWAVMGPMGRKRPGCNLLSDVKIQLCPSNIPGI